MFFYTFTRPTFYCYILMYSVTSPVSCVHKCVVYLFFFVLEVLLDMSASGSELGWLTLPYENGVSIHKHRYAFKVTKQRKEKKGRLKMSWCENVKWLWEQ